MTVTGRGDNPKYTVIPQKHPGAQHFFIAPMEPRFFVRLDCLGFPDEVNPAPTKQNPRVQHPALARRKWAEFAMYQKNGKNTWVIPKIVFFLPQIINFNQVFHYKPSILGVFPLFLETSTCKGWPPTRSTSYLVGGFSPIHLKNMRKSNWINSPNRDENKRIFETTTELLIVNPS